MAEFNKMMRRLLWFALISACVISLLSGIAGIALGPVALHPRRVPITATREAQLHQILARTHSTFTDLVVRTPDGILLRGWKIEPLSANGDWVLLFHGVADNRAGMLGHAELLLRHGYGVVMMDSRAQGESGGAIATYGWKECYDTIVVADALYSNENVRHLYGMGVSMGAGIALQSAAVEPRIEGVIAEDPFANLREASYDYAGMHFSPLLGKTLFRPASIVGMRALGKAAGLDPDEVSPERAVAARPFAVLLICGADDHTLPCRHAERIFKAAIGPKELWVVPGARHATTLGQDPAEYERRVIAFLAAQEVVAALGVRSR